ncbi:hypothetical protein B9Z65_1438 [Elsinoe australis]|uniref:Uncharacterized protein n=1 Tax=Elsinoe australis TaxID=40998 RepID=A0A2P7YFX1_9PEZI|nr:hypothetical protein B9Z65_1438 [Elsinoe australis]
MNSSKTPHPNHHTEEPQAPMILEHEKHHSPSKDITQLQPHRSTSAFDKAAFVKTIEDRDVIKPPVPFRLFDLPPEICRMVYKQVWKNAQNHSRVIEIVPPLPMRLSRRIGATVCPDLWALSLTCKAIHRETIQLVYEGITFGFLPCTGAGCPHTLKPWDPSGIQHGRISDLCVGLHLIPGVSKVFRDIMVHCCWGKFLDSLDVLVTGYTEDDGDVEDSIQEEYDALSLLWPQIVFERRVDITIDEPDGVWQEMFDEMEETRLRRLYPIEEEAEVGNSEGRTGEEK